jgi:enterochelin esterase-like enzyme
MRKPALTILFFLLLLVQLFAQAELRIMEGLSMSSRILKQDVKFSVCLPEDYYKSESSYPVVYLLHGLGDDAASWLEYGRISQYYDAEIANDAVTPMIFIMPEGYRDYYVNDYKGTFLYQDMFVKELVPHIDSMFRTVADKQHRSLTGYSMGGFGALVLHLKHPDIFGSAVPLSVSIRTDEQYMKEYGPEWDEQWGRLFGGQGMTGADRITDYYRQNCPFHIIAGLSSADMKNFCIYLDNGDKEETLCRSNEELHILMHSMNFPHEFRVRDGGHSFNYWCSALPNALHFMSDVFESRPYRGDIRQIAEPAPLPDKQLRQVNISNETILAFVPEEYDQTDRLYPVIYFAGKFTPGESRSIAAIVNQGIMSNEICPMLLVFLPENIVINLKTILPELEEELRIRPGYRFRSLAGYRDMAQEVCDIVINQEQFSSCILADAFLQKDSISSLLATMKPEALKRTPFYIDAPDKGLHYDGNGNLHMMMRDMELKHEYRVMEGAGGFVWMIGGFEEMLKFVAVNFHK